MIMIEVQNKDKEVIARVHVNNVAEADALVKHYSEGGHWGKDFVVMPYVDLDKPAKDNFFTRLKKAWVR